MKTVWIVKQGSYSNYHVVGIFSSKKNAQLVADKINTSETWEMASTSERPMDPGVDAINKGYTAWLGEMLVDGTVERMVEWNFDSYKFSGSLQLWKRSTAPAYKGKNVQDCLHGTVLAKDQKHAIKIFNERRMQMIAQGKWIQ